MSNLEKPAVPYRYTKTFSDARKAVVKKCPPNRGMRIIDIMPFEKTKKSGEVVVKPGVENVPLKVNLREDRQTALQRGNEIYVRQDKTGKWTLHGKYNLRGKRVK